jgi:hypothetical protein
MSENISIEIDYPKCTYTLQSGKRRGVRCLMPISKKCPLGAYCCSHYRIRSKKTIDPVEPIIHKYTAEQLKKFVHRLESEKKEQEEERLYVEWKNEKGE